MVEMQLQQADLTLLVTLISVLAAAYHCTLWIAVPLSRSVVTVMACWL
jgi:hypothetical protein